MTMTGNIGAKAEQPYYSEALEKLSVLADEIGKQLGELENRISVVSSPDGAVPQSEAQKETRGPISSLDERLSCLVGQFTVRRNDLGMILRRIQL